MATIKQAFKKRIWECAEKYKPTYQISYMENKDIRLLSKEDAEPGLALVGEEGPELVNFGGGEVVYTADETANILAKDTSSDSFYVEPEQAANDTAGGDRTVTFRVEGAGEMKVTGNGVTKEDVVSLLMSNMKDALIGIIQQEIEEEGDLSYEF